MLLHREHDLADHLAVSHGGERGPIVGHRVRRHHVRPDRSRLVETEKRLLDGTTPATTGKQQIPTTSELGADHAVIQDNGNEKLRA